uniref:GH16 domain-containing protein n=1 Tax=Timema poppense TaxID=170557 RepID=A0A7R9CVL6_TIMPO|nr:unnamed protein product [Timema poppensis]
MRVTVTLAFLALFGAGCSAQDCVESISKASGTKAPSTFCKGDLIFDEEFEVFDVTTWEHELTMSGGGNWEFEIYTNNRSNTFAQDGSLHIRPTLTSDHYGEQFLSSGTINLLGGAPADACTNPSDYGCERTGSVTNLLNPAQSARIRSLNSFSFRYGKVEIRARIPSGDWLWPALWLLPRYNAYSTWPASGEIDLAELRGNLDYVQNGVNIGTEQSSSTLHFGPYWPLNAYESAHFSKNTPAGAGFDKDYHLYQMEWTSDY